MNELKTRQYVAPFDFAVVSDALGQRQEALTWLEKAYDDQSEMMLFLTMYDVVADLRGEPRFRALVRRMGISPQ